MTESPDIPSSTTSSATSSTGSEAGGHQRRLARSTAVFSLATAVSRVLGLVREMVSAYFFGVSGKINAFTVAIQIPNLVRALVADAALSGAFVPVFSELLERGERKRAWRVASTLFWLTLLVLGGVTALFIVLAPLLIMGGALGAIESTFLPGGDRALWPLVSMAAALGGTMRSPLTSVVFALELTHDANSLPALLIASTVAHGFTVLAMKRSILTEKVARRGFHISREYATDPLEQLSIADVMATDVVSIPASMPIRARKTPISAPGLRPSATWSRAWTWFAQSSMRPSTRPRAKA